jgi:16S rRNA (adenine1518-N6/adenine1519-N6)-dimethyltransferase
MLKIRTYLHCYQIKIILVKFPSITSIPLMKKTDVISIIQQYGLAPNKKLGQNFLISEQHIGKIIDAVSPGADEAILEIGPGLGAVTNRLAQVVRKLTVIEIDSGFVRYLGDAFGGCDNVEVIHNDFLETRIDGDYSKVVSNLPYYCASEILFRLAREYSAPEVFVLIQKEMADRILSRPGNKNYGAMSVTLGFYFETSILFNIGKDCFYPRPEVNSSFIKLVRREFLPLNTEEIHLFHAIVKSAFWGRRKTIIRALAESPHLSLGSELARRVLDGSGILHSTRGEDLSIDDYVRLTSALHKES